MNKVGGPIGPPTHLGGIDLVTNINYNGGKEVDYAYNAVGDLVRMEDWTGVNTFEYDLLSQLKSVTDHKGNVVSYTYDDNGNKTSLTYPDDTTVTYTYDGVGNLTSVTESDGRTTTYTYDGMGRLVKMEYPHGWVEEYEYDAVGQLLRVTDTDPSGKDMKQQKHVYEYDECGNLVYEYMRGNGTGEATVENTYTYDALHRLTGAVENYGNQSRSYVYDSLGNLTYESNSNNEARDYKLNDLNQVTEKTDAKGKESTYYTYDGRGNLILEEYGKNNKRDTVAEYTYDETNRMVLGENSSAETSAYEINGLGALVEQTWVIAKNGYGYHDVDAAVEEPAPEVPEIPEQAETGEETTEPEVPEVTEPEEPETGVNNEGNGNDNGNTGNGHDKGNSGKGDGAAEETPAQPETGSEPIEPEVTEPETPETGEEVIEPETPEITETTEPEQPEATEPAETPETPEIPEAETTLPDEAVSVATTLEPGVTLLVSNGKGNSDKKDPDKPTGSDVKKTSTVVKQFVVDYTTETFEPLMEHEVNGLDYKYVYGNDRLSVDIWSVNNSGSIVENGDHIRLYYHMDYLGTADYLTSPVSLRVEAWTHYNEWGEITHNAVLNCGQRELDLVKRYATHDYDAVLDLYYAKARMYDAERRQFNSVDSILDPSVYDLKTYTDDPVQFVQYLYVQNQPLNFIDPLGLNSVAATIRWGSTAWPLVAIDGPIPAGDLIYVVGYGVCVLVDSGIAYYSANAVWDMVQNIADAKANGLVIPVSEAEAQLQQELKAASTLQSFSEVRTYSEELDSLIDEYIALAPNVIGAREMNASVNSYGAFAVDFVNSAFANRMEISADEYFTELKCDATAIIQDGGVKRTSDWSVYALVTKDVHKVFYIGMTNDPSRRLAEHRRSDKAVLFQGFEMRTLKTGIPTRQEARVHEQIYMTAFFTEICEAKANKIRSISSSKLMTGQVRDILLSIAADVAENELLALMDEVHFTR